MSPGNDEINSKEIDRKSYLLQLKESLHNREIGLNIDFEDTFLVKFLRSRLYNVAQTCNHIKNYVSLFKKYPQCFQGVDYCSQPLKDGVFYVIPDRNVSGETIGVFRAGLWDPSTTTFSQAMFTTVYGYELAALDESTQRNGVIEIMDLQEFGMKHFLRIGLSEIRMAVGISESSLPIRYTKIFVVYENTLTDIVFSFAKPLMSKEFREKFHFLGHDLTKLHESVPKHILPPKYGGTSQRCDHIEYYKKLKGEESRLMKLWKPFKFNATD